MLWTTDFKNLARKWPWRPAAQAEADKLENLIGHWEYCGTVTEIVVCEISDKPASDPGSVVWGIRGTFETESGELELWLQD